MIVFYLYFSPARLLLMGAAHVLTLDSGFFFFFSLLYLHFLSLAYLFAFFGARRSTLFCFRPPLCSSFLWCCADDHCLLLFRRAVDRGHSLFIRVEEFSQRALSVCSYADQGWIFKPSSGFRSLQTRAATSDRLSRQKQWKMFIPASQIPRIRSLNAVFFLAFFQQDSIFYRRGQNKPENIEDFITLTSLLKIQIRE